MASGPTHDDVTLTRHERREMARLAARLAPDRDGPAPGAGQRCRERSDPVALLVAGMAVLAGATIATSPLLAAAGTALSLCALVRSVLRARGEHGPG